jgi:tripartite-type tricarboxylate transporter receptor subunit TctC
MIRVVLTALLLAASVGSSLAANYPNRPIRLIVGYPAGGSTDVLARLMAAKLSDLVGQQVIVENKPGATGNIATEFVVRSPADGYTLSIGGAASTINASLQKNLTYDFARDLAPVGLTSRSPNIMVVPAASPAKTPAEFIAYTKANPGKVNYASSGNGASTHMAAELFKLVTRAEMTHVPYRGNAPALTDLITGQTQVMFDNLPSSAPFIRAGQLRALAITGSARTDAFPELPTLKELGYDVEVYSWTGLYAPAATPREIVDYLGAQLLKIVAMPDYQARLKDLGAEAVPMGPDELGAYTRVEITKWAKVVEVSGAKID